MTFGSNSVDLRSLRAGQIWKQTLANLSARIYLVVVGPRVYAPDDRPQVPQVTMLDLESGKVRRVNAKAVHQKNGWQIVKSKKAFAFLSTSCKVSS